MRRWFEKGQHTMLIARQCPSVKNGPHPAKKGAYRLVLTQFFLGVTLALVFFLCLTTKVALSALLGASIATLANGFFARKVFSVWATAQFAKRAVRGFYHAQAMKMLITAGLFMLCFQFVSVCGWSFLTGYLLVQLSAWLSPLFLTD